MNFVPLVTPVLQKGEDLFAFFCNALFDLSKEITEGRKTEKTEKIEEYTVIIISSKLLALSQGRTSFNDLEEIIREESDQIISGGGGFFLTEKSGIIIPNAGIDQSNAPHQDEKILWPENPQSFSDIFREKIQKKYGVKNIGVIVSDSRITPMRKGTTGVALAWSGIKGVLDLQGKKDIYEKPLKVSSVNVADNLVSGAEILMGQSDEQTPFVLVHHLPEKYFTDIPQSPQMGVISALEDLFHYIPLKN